MCYIKIKFADKADAATFSFYYHSSAIKNEDEEDY